MVKKTTLYACSFVMTALLLMMAGCVRRDDVVEQLAEPHKLVLSATVDFSDNALYTADEDYYTVGELRARLKKAYDAGFRKIYFRGTGGVSYYDSAVRPRYTFGFNPVVADKMVKAMNTYDPVAEYIRCCHELGMELYYWEPIFDNSLWMQLFPGMEGYDQYGQWPCGDPKLPPELCVAHRKSYIPQQNLPQPLTTLELRLIGKTPEVTDENLLIYTAAHGQPFTRYDKPFQVAIENCGNGVSRLTLSGLELTQPVIKFASDAFVTVTDTEDDDAVAGYYADGTRCDLLQSFDVTWPADGDHIHTLAGVGGMGYQWGGNGATMIARFGDVQRYAAGVPEFAYPECRDRIKDIVKELYERYPELDGVAFSIRTHSLPSPGGTRQLGGGNFHYGFSEPIVREYKELYGVDPQMEDYDQTAFLKIRGKYITMMLGEVAEVVHSHGGKLEMMAPVTTSTYEGSISPGDIRAALGSMYKWWYHTGIDDMFDIRAWAQNGSVDNVIMLGTGYQQSLWTSQWQAEVARFREHLAGTPTKLTLHYLVSGETPEMISSILPPILEEAGLDEVEFYEEDNMNRENTFPVIRQMVENSSRPIL